ncbi:dedicator of cytokinesis protein 9 isoform X5 [Neodiprion virginianus]|uniref:dedicator of cytokinesis protein 9 isoform X5 n=1 Tax=Neodiprion virginianus TaxID=2961670 RepID=UPI001EE75900|nr:dedicator of cytokinesis protein 9 isoform X5 [Neodiprion virginianus]
MSERKFTRGLGKPGMAAQLRETVSQVVRESTVQNKPHLVDPIDFENFVQKNKTLLQNDPQRELLLYPQDDVSQVVLPRRYRTVVSTVRQVSESTESEDGCSLLTKECLKTYSSNWNLVHYKYTAYSGSYLELPKITNSDYLKDEVYEIDTEVDQVDEDSTKSDGITKQGYLMKGPEIGSDRMFVHIGSKSFKRRYCHLRQEVDGTYILELFKDEKKGEAKLTIVMDFCSEVVRNTKRGRYCFELRMTGTHKSYSLAADSEIELQDWLLKLSSVLQHYKQQEDKRSASLERACTTPPPSPQPMQVYGTLKGLEQSMNPQLIRYSRETDTSIALSRRENRRRLFCIYPHIPHAKSPTGSSPDTTVDPYKEQFGQRLLIKCESLKFRLQAPIDEKDSLCQVEPYQTTLCLFDVRNGRKLTENFHFDINNEVVRNISKELSPVGIMTEKEEDVPLPEEIKSLPKEWLMYPKQAIFSVSNPHPDIFLVVRIDKILQGGICQTSEPYIRATKDPRLGLKLHKQVKAACQRLGNYTMPFAWAARPLFRLYSNELDTASDFPAIYRQEGNKIKDDELLKLLSEYRKPEKLSKLTIIPGWLKLKIEPITEIPENTLTTSFVPLKPFPIPPTSEPTLEIAEFEGSSEREVHPYITYINHLYVYPQTLSFDTQKIFTRARNIACIVELRDNDSENAQPIRCIYGKPGLSILRLKASCSVLHHNAVPSWYEEIKMRLPTKLSSKHHLLFSFYHISCDMNKKKENGVENCVGYSWAPLLHKGRLNVDVQVLPVATHLPAGYLSIQPLGLGKGFVFVSPSKETGITTVHEELGKHLPTLLQPSNTDFLVVNKFMHHSSFFFDIMIKSMAQHLLTTGRIKMHRNERFSKEYHKNIENLLDVIMPYLMKRYKEMPVETQELNKSLAHFLKKCLTFMDRGFVFRLINSYMDNFAPGDPRALHDFKFMFLQIICSHEHYVSFNLPMMQSRITSRDTETEPDSDELMNEYCLSENFCKHHFLVGLLLQEVKTSLNEIVQIRKVAVATLRDLMAKHELDDRYQNKGQLSRIASIYIPWLGIVLENLHRLELVHDSTSNSEGKQNTSNRISSSSSFLLNRDTNSNNTTSTSTPRSMHRFTLNLDTQSPIRVSMHLRDSTYFAAIAGQGLVNGNSCTSIESDASTMSGASQSNISQETAIIREPTENGTHEHKGHSRSLSVTQTSSRCDKLQSAEVKDLLLCFLFVVKHLGDHQIIAWWQQCSDIELLSFFTVIEMSLYQFKYVGKRQIASNSTSAGGKPRTVKAMTLPARMAPPDFSSETSGTGTLQTHNTVARENLAENESGKLHQALLEANMATEVGLIALDCLGLYCIHFKDALVTGDGYNPVMRKIFDIYLSFLQVGQSETLLRHVFAGFRAFLNNYSVTLFQGNAVLCGRLCYELLRCCNSKLSSIRQESCALLYLLMRSNFEFTSRKGLTRVHLQVIISVSQMLGNVIGLNNSRFQESLSLINSYASSDKAMKGTGFPVEVKDLTKRIRTVLMATAQMREHNNDPEMLVDLQHSLANSYASTPELRHTWLETMARNHARVENFSEAACCQLHIAALMAEYLKLKKIHTWGAEAFDKISVNISRDERGLKLDAGEICVQDIHYNEYLLLEQLEACTETLEKAERFELLGQLYRLIIPMYESKRNYQALSNCYTHLAQACNKVVEVTKSGKRLLGRFYRVAFFGSAYFEDESGQEYIYKEPKVTSLSEISERLNRLYSEKFGHDVVKMIMDSVPVNNSELDPKMAYIQVTHVIPYFEKLELEIRVTEFEQNHDVCCFMFETPFTREGKPRGNPEDQWKRRTILTTQYSFPYVKKRIAVCQKRVVELSPIEVALDEMRQRVAELEDVALIAPADAKKLQLRLQGSVCVTVNAGPLAYASAFLDPALSPQYPDDKVEDLKDVFREFVKICYTALQINSKLITSDQHEYQEVLRENYQKLCQNLSSLLGESVWPDEQVGSFKRNSAALFSAISGANNHTSTA